MSANPFQGKSLLAVQNSDATVVAYEGSVRSGKTFTSVVQWMDYVRSAPPGNLLMVGRTERTVKQNVIDTMQDMVGDKRCRLVGGQGVLWLFGRRIYIVGANDERSVTKIQGLTLAGSYVDECATLPETFFEMLHTRHSIEGAKIFLTSNPASPAHWLKTKWLDRARLWIDRDGVFHRNSDGIDLHRVTFVLDDNEENLPSGFIPRLKESYTGLFYRRYILAEWVAAEGGVFPQWDESVHVVEPERVPPIIRWLCVAVDYGTNNPFSAILLGVGVDHCIYAVSEWRWDSSVQKRCMTDIEYSEALRGWLREPTKAHRDVVVPWVVVDPSASSFKVQLRRDGMRVCDADNSVLDGIRMVSSLLTLRRLKVSRDCPGLIGEMPGYVWDDKAALRGEDKPLKVNDHSCDSGRYGIYTTRGTWRTLVPMEELKQAA